MRTSHSQRGFTLVEMTVSVGLFTIVLFIATSAFLSIVNADRKARSVRIATDNLNLSLEDMTRKIKTGYSYDCGAVGAPLDCTTGTDSVFRFTAQDGVATVYQRATGATCGTGFGSRGCIRRSDGGTTATITSPEIDITRLNFVVRGAAVGAADNRQPSVVVLVEGTVAVPGKTALSSTFKIQSLVTQRAYDN